MSLQLDYNELRRSIGRFIGAGRTVASWTPENINDIEDIIKSGLRDFYWPTQEDGTRHPWSFLSRDAILTVASGDTKVGLPSDFLQLTNVLIAGKPLSQVPEDRIRSLISSKPLSGRPIYFALRTVTAEQSAGGITGHEILIYPVAKEETAITFRYSADPLELNAANPHPQGGLRYSETILASCLAAAERILDPEAGGGIHSAKFATSIAAAIGQDSQLSTLDIDENLWPLDSVDGSTGGLSVNRGSLSRLIGKALGFGVNSATWSHGQQSEVGEVVRMGLRKFYCPAVMPGEKFPHTWSFLEPLSTLDLVAGQDTYDLPEDFAMIKGAMTFADSSNVSCRKLDIISESQVRSRKSKSFASGIPAVGAVRVKPVQAGVGTRYELVVWPPPSQEQTLEYRYSINPDQLHDDDDLPLGGQPHAQTVIESCLAAAEIYQGAGSSRSLEFASSLRASIGYDRQASTPDSMSLGYGTGDCVGHSGRRCDDSLVTYNGEVH